MVNAKMAMAGANDGLDLANKLFFQSISDRYRLPAIERPL